MTQETLNTQLANAVAAVASANDYLARMTQLLNHARRNHTDAINMVNQAQKNFDELVAQVKKSAPRETDWKRPDGGVPPARRMLKGFGYDGLKAAGWTDQQMIDGGYMAV